MWTWPCAGDPGAKLIPILETQEYRMLDIKGIPAIKCSGCGEDGGEPCSTISDDVQQEIAIMRGNYRGVITFATHTKIVAKAVLNEID